MTVKLQEKKRTDSEGKSSEDASDAKEENREEIVINLRSLNMEDMKQAKNQVNKIKSDFIFKNQVFETCESASKSNRKMIHLEMLLILVESDFK